MANRRLWFKSALSASLLILLAVYLFVAREARNEIYYLCSNFITGVAEADVLRQLDTAVWSDYLVADSAPGRTLILSSQIHFRAVECRIVINKNHKVSASYYL